MIGRRRTPEPCEALAAEEQARGDNTAAFLASITGNPGYSPTTLDAYRASIQDAFGNAAAATAQPADVPRKKRWGQ
ncbi:hypothetical protein [Streptomyces aidingensis]|uniref:Uncharacterized protein n=1 Tax=Streptomyces aidingensis TaxID=910347 RepID=A0A1I1PVJ2_9ACTN|nr:hypothetical protein [Streptomyces aidingensis]SFD13879.1 hypothetical protein SAMN05421773_11081 [Streptomyces aidingensis]